MADERYKITIEGLGLNMTRELEEETALHILSVALGNTSGFAPTGRNAATEGLNTDDNKETPSSQEATSNVSTGEFMAELEIANNVERIAAVALYLKDELGRPLMKKEDINDWFQKAGQAAPKNLPRDIQSAVKKRPIAEDNNESGSYFVTATGENALRATD